MNEISDEEEWECYLCAREHKMTSLPGGWIGDSHTLSDECADNIYFDPNSKFRGALTYHYECGRIETSVPTDS